MKFSNLGLLALCMAATMACTLDKTDFEAELNTEIPKNQVFEEAIKVGLGTYTLSVEVLDGTFYKGYNPIRATLYNSQNEPVTDDFSLQFLPLATLSDASQLACPHTSELVFNHEQNNYTGYVIFTDQSTDQNSWQTQWQLATNGQTHVGVESVRVEDQPNKNLNMTMFTGNDGEQYCIALVAPMYPKVAENPLVVAIYQYQEASQTYTTADAYTLLLDPRMPEPSMGNHSSPNNVDLTQQQDGLYHGVVNYTMIGNWTLNFILLNNSGEVVKGTEVPTDFTPGVEGAKSELHIDILF